MISALGLAVSIGTTVIATLSLAYVAGCVIVVLAWRRTRECSTTTATAPVTVLKPLCGLETELSEHLRSFCRQTHVPAEILFGARDPADAALSAARDVAIEFPHLDTRVIVGERTLGENRKINTLAHLLPLARHDVLVIADSDVHVGPEYLARVAAPLADPAVGIVTCLYRAQPTNTIWSRLGALAIDEWFIPSVLVSRALGSEAYCSGATIALRRDVLEAAGGFRALAPLLADDYELGARVRRLGHRCVLAPYEVAVTVHEASFDSLLDHELRWMRTVRTVTPLGHALSFLQYALPLSLLATIVTGFAAWTVILPTLALLLRIALHYATGRNRRSFWLLPVRDLLSFAEWVMSYANRRVTWRGRTMRVRSDGVLLIPQLRPLDPKLAHLDHTQNGAA